MDYLQLLRHPNWQKKRLEIFQRDNWMCQKCQDTQSNLQVHHLYYNLKCQPWEYPNEALITYCDLCHTKAEFYKWVNSFGIRALIYHGFIRTDIDELKQFIFVKVENNHHRESSIQYMSDIKKLMSYKNG